MYGSVTNAWSAMVTIGSRRPAIAATWLDQPAVAFTTRPAAIAPRSVRTPRHSPSTTSMPVTAVCSWMWIPRRVALAAYPHTTESCRANEPGGWKDAPTIGNSPPPVRSIRGFIFAISAGVTTSVWTP